MNRLESSFENAPNLVGTVLVASPRLNSTPMAQAVVLVVQDSDTGVFGVHINDTASTEQAVAFEKASHLFSHRDALMIGGPLDGPVMALHQNESLAEIQIRDGVFVSCSQDALEMLVEGDPELTESPDHNTFEFTDEVATESDRRSPYRIVVGMAGWQRSRINAEIQSGLWYPIEADPNIVFESPEAMWIKGFRRYGNDVLWDVTGLNAHGVDCRLN